MRTTGQRLTHGATVSLVSSHHQSRASTFIHCIDLCSMAKHQLKSCYILGISSSMQGGPTGTERDGVISVKASGAVGGLKFKGPS